MMTMWLNNSFTSKPEWCVKGTLHNHSLKTMNDKKKINISTLEFVVVADIELHL